MIKMHKNDIFIKNNRSKGLVKMILPNDVDKVTDENWEEFKKQALKDELFYKGEGDLLDTPEGRALFCRNNETSIFRKDDPNYAGYKIWVFNNKGQGMVIKRRSMVDPEIMEDIEYDANGIEISKSYEPA